MDVNYIGDDNMFIFAALIIISIVLYLYYKVAILRTKDTLTQRYMNEKARIYLGVFLISFGINQYIFYQTRLVLFISIVFILLGIYQMYHGFKAAKHYRNEWRRLNPDG